MEEVYDMQTDNGKEHLNSNHIFILQKNRRLPLGYAVLAGVVCDERHRIIRRY